jgi:hypothetical protein
MSEQKLFCSLLLRFPFCDRILEKGSVPIAKMFQSSLLVGIQSGFDFGQRSVESVARLLHRLNLDRLHLSDRGFNPWTDLLDLLRCQMRGTRQPLSQSLSPAMEVSLRSR